MAKKKRPVRVGEGSVFVGADQGAGKDLLIDQRDCCRR